MKKNKPTFIFLSMAMLLLISCSNHKVFEQHHKFENLSWNRFNNIEYEVNIEGTENDYDIYLNFRHLPEYPYRNIDFSFTIYTPSGEMRAMDYEIDLFDKQGKPKSKCLGDYCVLKIRLREGFRFSEPGKARFVIENKMKKLETPGILEVGLIIEKSKN